MVYRMGFKLNYFKCLKTKFISVFLASGGGGVHCMENEHLNKCDCEKRQGRFILKILKIIFGAGGYLLT